MKKTLAVVALPIAVVLGGALQVGRPVPAVAVEVAQPELKLPGTFKVDLPKQGQMAVGELGLGQAAATPNQEPVAIASLAKMMTAYLLLQAQPLEKGQDGPTTTITAEDVKIYEHDRAAGYSVAKVAAGDKLTERQLLEALMLPSADNIATLIAKQVAGSEEAFVGRMNATAKALGMDQTTYADASGVDPATVSTASDQLRIAQAVMANRVLREVVAQPQADLPTAGRVYNVNFMVGKQGMSGVKTGSTLAAGSCFVGSFPITVDGKPRMLLGAVLGQVSLREALGYDVAMLHAVAPQFKTYALPLPKQGIAHVNSPWQGKIALAAAQPVKVFGYPGMPVALKAELAQPTLPIPLGRPAAKLEAAGVGFDLKAGRVIEAPDLWWRLTRGTQADAATLR
jgi:D-alanyl-D-alanine carboxypeptidase (penicillin-binding protein 5/6)